MKNLFVLYILLITAALCNAQQNAPYNSLDKSDPIAFGGDNIIYDGKIIKLGPKAFFIDGALSDEFIAKHKYVFNSVNKAAENLTDGSESEPMTLYIAPYVYWIDNPDDPQVRVAAEGGSPYGLIVKCEWLRFYGLNKNASNVVLACNRGQSLGSQGNFTMFRISGQGTSSENITFGNYCNIDLNFPLKPELNRAKRGEAIVQAQLIHCNGDKILARNTRFVSRLNLCPFTGGKRVLFDRCHFESTDDALCGTGVYLNCTLDIYGSKPFYSTSGTGAVFLNSIIRSFVRGEQYFTKANGQVAAIDTKIISETANYIGWRNSPPKEIKNYQYNVSLNDKNILIGSRDAKSTIDMTGKKVLDAYRIVKDNRVIYNTHNLLSGNDDWDPMNVRNENLPTGIPVQLTVKPTGIRLETGKDKVTLNAQLFRFGNFPVRSSIINWSVSQEHKNLVKLEVVDNGYSCNLTPFNQLDTAVNVVVTASTPEGLEASSVLTIAPYILDSPGFKKMPKIRNSDNGYLNVQYTLDTDYPDFSQISWYRCSDKKGSNAIEVAVSRENTPLNKYELTEGDIGYYIMAVINPAHIRSFPGTSYSSIYGSIIKEKDVKSTKNKLSTDFRNISVKDQPQIIPGFFTFDSFTTSDHGRTLTADKSKNAWFFGEGVDGSEGIKGLLQSQNARMFYTPVDVKSGNMRIRLNVFPAKTAGQGFSMAYRYMDILIKLDTRTLTGYGVRFIRTTKYHDAVDCILMKYDNGKATEISKPVSTSCYRPDCNITVEVMDNVFSVKANTGTQYYIKPDRSEVKSKVDISEKIEGNTFGGFGIDYSGGASTLIKQLDVEWL